MVFTHGYVCALVHMLYETHTVPSSCLLLHSYNGSIHEYVFTLIEGSRLIASAVGDWYGLVSKSPHKSMAMEIWYECSSWKVPSNWVMVQIHSSSLCCCSSWKFKGTLSSVQGCFSFSWAETCTAVLRFKEPGLRL